jgi:hypothetical protein
MMAASIPYNYSYAANCIREFQPRPADQRISNFMGESGVLMIATQWFGLVIAGSLNAMDPLNATDTN